MGEPKKTTIDCAGCGTKIEVMAGEGHTGIAKCSCGATTYVRGEPGDMMKEINKIIGQVPALLKQFKEAKRAGYESGIDAGIHEATKALVSEVLNEETELRDALKEHVRIAIRGMLMGPEEGNIS